MKGPVFMRSRKGEFQRSVGINGDAHRLLGMRKSKEIRSTDLTQRAGSSGDVDEFIAHDRSLRKKHFEQQ